MLTFPAPLCPSYKTVMCPLYIERSSLSTATFEPPVEFLYSFLRPVDGARRGGAEVISCRAELQHVGVRDTGEMPRTAPNAFEVIYAPSIDHAELFYVLLLFDASTRGTRQTRKRSVLHKILSVHPNQSIKRSRVAARNPYVSHVTHSSPACPVGSTHRSEAYRE